MKKNTLCFAALTFAAAVAVAGPEDYVNSIIQIQQDTGTEWLMNDIAPQDSDLSPEGIGPEGSLFQLWSVHTLTAVDYLLDEEFVSSYSPNAEITIVTGDPYPHVARTRVDQPFQVQVDISGLVHGGGAPLAAGQVLLDHVAGTYPAGEHSFPNDGNGNGAGNGHANENHDPRGSALLIFNGLYVLNYGFTTLTGPDLTKVEGEEVWTVYMLDGGQGGNPFVRGDVLESALLQVWPIADATISGVDTAETYENLPPIAVSLNDLYPDSTTHIRVYSGPPSTNPSEVIDVPTSYVIIEPTSIPQDRVVDIRGIDDLFPRSGAYTMEVVHQTPFGTEILTQLYPLNIERTISVRGAVYSSE